MCAYAQARMAKKRSAMDVLGSSAPKRTTDETLIRRVVNELPFVRLGKEERGRETKGKRARGRMNWRGQLTCDLAPPRPAPSACRALPRSLPCPALPCPAPFPALPCPVPCPALPCPALPRPVSDNARRRSHRPLTRTRRDCRRRLLRTCLRTGPAAPRVLSHTALSAR